MESARIAHKIIVDESSGQVFIDDQAVDICVLLAIIEADARVLWRFVKKDGYTIAVPYTEKEVLWMDKEVEIPEIKIARNSRGNTTLK